MGVFIAEYVKNSEKEDFGKAFGPVAVKVIKELGFEPYYMNNGYQDYENKAEYEMYLEFDILEFKRGKIGWDSEGNFYGFE